MDRSTENESEGSDIEVSSDSEDFESEIGSDVIDCTSPDFVNYRNGFREGQVAKKRKAGPAGSTSTAVTPKAT